MPLSYWCDIHLGDETSDLKPAIHTFTNHLAFSCHWVIFARIQWVVLVLYKLVPTRSRWMSNNYITRCQSWSQLVEVRVAVRDSENQLPAEGLGLQNHRLSSLAEWERSAAIVRGTWGQYVAVFSVSNSPLTLNPFTTLSNKVWEIYFSKEGCSFVIIVDYVSACIRIVVSQLYNKYI